MLVREIKVMMEVKNEKGFARLNGYGKEVKNLVYFYRKIKKL